MANDSVVQTLLRFLVDKQAANQTEKTIDDLEKALGDYQKAAQAAGKASDKAFERLAVEAKAGMRGINDVTKAIEEQTAALQERKKVESFGDLSTGAGALASVGGALGTNLGGASIIGDLAGFAEYVPRLKDSIGNLVGTGAQAVTTLGAMSAAAIALGAAAVVIDRFNRGVAESASKLETNIQIQAQYYQDLQTLSTDAARTQLETFQSTRDGLLAEQEAVKALIAQAEGQIDDAFGVLSGPAQLFVETLSTLPTEQLRERLKALGGELSGAETGINLYSDAISANAFAANDATEAERRLTEARIATITDDADIQRRLNSAARGTADAAQERTEIITEELAIIQQQINSYRALGQDTAALERQYTNLGTEQAYLLDQVLPMLRAREAEAQALKDYQEQSAEFAEEYHRRIEEETKAEETRLKNIADVQRRFEDQELQIKERAAQQLADVEQKAADKIIDINRKAADDEQRVLEELQQRRVDLARDLAREESDARQELADTDLQQQIDFQRTEVQARKDHLQNLEDIQRRAQEEEFDLSLNRDFQGLFRRRRQTTQELNEAQRSFDKDREARLTAYNQQNEDDLRQFEVERRNRQQNYQRQLADANTAAAQERAAIQQQKIAALSDANNAAIRERQLLQQKTQSELTLRQQAYQRELQLAALSANERLALDAKVQQAFITNAMKTLAALSGGKSSGGSGSSGGGFNGGKISGKALGGSVMAGQTFMVNENGAESFSSGGKTGNFPSGLGYFTAAKSGTINTAGQTAAMGNSLPPISISIYESGNTAKTRAVVLDVLEQVMGR